MVCMRANVITDYWHNGSLCDPQVRRQIRFVTLPSGPSNSGVPSPRNGGCTNELSLFGSFDQNCSVLAPFFHSTNNFAQFFWSFLDGLTHDSYTRLLYDHFVIVNRGW